MFRQLAILLAAAILVAGGVVASVSLAGNGPGGSGPPGQGECEHGNSGQECRPDPNEHGQDCDEHGPFEGGVNEDHCLPSTTTVPTVTTPTTVTPVESTPGRPRCPSGQGPFAGKDEQAGNDECCPDSNNDQQCDHAAPAPTVDDAGLASEMASPPRSTESNVVKPAQKSRVRTSSTRKTLKARTPKLTGNAKVDKCKPVKGNLLNCKGIIVTPGQG